MDDNSLAYSRYNCTHHIVFIPKYRRKAMFGELRKEIGWSIKREPLLSGLPVKKERFARPPLGGNAKVLPQGGFPIPPAELVVGPLGGELYQLQYAKPETEYIKAGETGREYLVAHGFISVPDIDKREP